LQISSLLKHSIITIFITESYFVSFQDETISVELKGGIAEIFGTEMVQNTKYTFKTGAKFAVFTYHGCQILVSTQ